MIPDSLRTRGVFFAYMFGPPRFVSRDEASKVHGRVCDALGLDDLAFKYGATGAAGDAASKGFTLTVERGEDRGNYKVEVDNQNVRSPIRMLMSYTWPPSLEEVKERMDLTAAAVFEGIGGEWTRVMAEVRLRAQCNVRSNDALGYLMGQFVRGNAGWIESLGKPLTFGSVRFEVEATPPGDDPLEGAKREFVIEVLRDDPHCVYLELMSQWPHVPPAAAGTEFNPSGVRSIEQPPSAYLEEAYGFLTDRVQGLGGNPRVEGSE